MIDEERMFWQGGEGEERMNFAMGCEQVVGEYVGSRLSAEGIREAIQVVVPVTLFGREG
jgi:hypothetical protein